MPLKDLAIALAQRDAPQFRSLISQFAVLRISPDAYDHLIEMENQRNAHLRNLA